MKGRSILENVLLPKKIIRDINKGRVSELSGEDGNG